MTLFQQRQMAARSTEQNKAGVQKGAQIWGGKEVPKPTRVHLCFAESSIQQLQSSLTLVGDLSTDRKWRHGNDPDGVIPD